MFAICSLFDTAWHSAICESVFFASTFISDVNSKGFDNTSCPTRSNLLVQLKNLTLPGKPA